MSAQESLPSLIDPLVQPDPERVFALIDRILPFEVCLYHQVLPLDLQDDQIILGVVNRDADLSYVQRMLAHLNDQLVYRLIALETQQELLSAFLSYDCQRKSEGYVEPSHSESWQPSLANPQPNAASDSPAASLGHGTLGAGTDSGPLDPELRPLVEVSDCLSDLQPALPTIEYGSVVGDLMDDWEDDELDELGETISAPADFAHWNQLGALSSPDEPNPDDDMETQPVDWFQNDDNSEPFDPWASPQNWLSAGSSEEHQLHHLAAHPSLVDPRSVDLGAADLGVMDLGAVDVTETLVTAAQSTPDPDWQQLHRKGELAEACGSPLLTSDDIPDLPMDTLTNHAVVTASELGTGQGAAPSLLPVDLSTERPTNGPVDLPAELAELEQALVQALERSTPPAQTAVPSASEVEAAWIHPTVSVPIEWADLNPSPLVLHTRYADRPLSELGDLPPRALMQELLQRAIEGGIGRLYFDRPELDRTRILCSRDGIMQAALDPLLPSTFQGVIDELKLLANLPLLPPVGKPRQVEIERIYRSELLLLRLRIAPGRLGEEATLQVLRGAALKFHQRQQLSKLSQDAIDLTRQLQKKLAEMQVRASLSQDFNPRSQELTQLMGVVQRLIERLGNWRSI